MSGDNTHCPGCSEPVETGTRLGPGVIECAGCGGTITTRPIWLGETFRYVSNSWDPEGSFEGARYYDLTYLGSKGLGRRHGWYQPKTKGIVQTG